MPLLYSLKGDKLKALSQHRKRGFLMRLCGMSEDSASKMAGSGGKTGRERGEREHVLQCLTGRHREKFGQGIIRAPNTVKSAPRLKTLVLARPDYVTTNRSGQLLALCSQDRCAIARTGRC